MNQEILKRLDLLAGKLGVAADHLWALLVRQARVEAVEDIMFVVFTIILTTVVVKIWLRVAAPVQRNNKYGDVVTDTFGDWADNHIPQTIGLMVATLGAAICVSISTAMLFSDIPNELFNPEYWALNHILSLLKQ